MKTKLQQIFYIASFAWYVLILSGVQKILIDLSYPELIGSILLVVFFIYVSWNLVKERNYQQLLFNLVIILFPIVWIYATVSDLMI